MNVSKSTMLKDVKTNSKQKPVGLSGFWSELNFAKVEIIKLGYRELVDKVEMSEGETNKENLLRIFKAVVTILKDLRQLDKKSDRDKLAQVYLDNMVNGAITEETMEAVHPKIWNEFNNNQNSNDNGGNGGSSSGSNGGNSGNNGGNSSGSNDDNGNGSNSSLPQPATTQAGIGSILPFNIDATTIGLGVLASALAYYYYVYQN